ncbi:hypothetical protein HDE_12989 [Halotydeus destructor]|nr:hypothetical protein HDE_12989 [Halotydeus destructor]
MPYTGAPLIPGKVLIINGTFPGLRPAEPAPAKARMSTLKMALLIVGILVIIALIVLLYVYSKTLKRLNHKRREVDRLKKTPLPPVNKPLMDSPKEMAPLPPKKPYMPPGAFSYQMNTPTTPTLPSPTEGIYEHLPGQDSGSEEEYEEPIPMNPLQRPLPRTPA